MDHLAPHNRNVPPMDHRWGERFTVDLAVKVAGRPFAVRAGRLTNLSVSGGAIQISADIRLLTRVQVAIAAPNRFLDPIPVVSGYVTRKFGDHIGVEWSEFAPGAVRELLKVARAHRRELLARPQTLIPFRESVEVDAHEAAAPAAKTLSL
jgi:hypothetical protein